MTTMEPPAKKQKTCDFTLWWKNREEQIIFEVIPNTPAMNQEYPDLELPLLCPIPARSLVYLGHNFAESAKNCMHNGVVPLRKVSPCQFRRFSAHLEDRFSHVAPYDVICIAESLEDKHLQNLVTRQFYASMMGVAFYGNAFVGFVLELYENPRRKDRDFGWSDLLITFVAFSMISKKGPASINLTHYTEFIEETQGKEWKGEICARLADQFCALRKHNEGKENVKMLPVKMFLVEENNDSEI